MVRKIFLSPKIFLKVSHVPTLETNIKKLGDNAIVPKLYLYLQRLTAIYVNCIFFTLCKSYDIFWFWFHLFLCICFPSLRPENYLIVFIRLIRAKYGEYSDKSFKEIYELFYKYDGGKTKAEVELKRVETLRREKRESRRAGNKKADDSSSSEDEEDVEIKRSTLDPNLLENEEQAMPNINLDCQKETEENRQKHLEALIAQESPTKRTGLKKYIPSFLIKKSNFQKQTKIEERGNEKTEKLLAEQERKQGELALLRERARIERRRKNFASSIEILLTSCRLVISFNVFQGTITKKFLYPRNSYNADDIIKMFYESSLLIDIVLFDLFAMYWY